MDMEAWRAAIHGVARVRYDEAIELNGFSIQKWTLVIPLFHSELKNDLLNLLVCFSFYFLGLFYEDLSFVNHWYPPGY